MLRHGATWLLVALLTVLAPAAAQVPQPVDGPRPIEIRARQITSFDARDESARRFGMLEFRGGLVLTSPNKAFGGLSALRLARDGLGFVAATDRGNWLRGKIRYDGDRPVGIAGAEIAPMLGPDGKPLVRRGWYDTEAVTAGGGTLYVGIERVNRIVRFNYGKRGLNARAEVMKVPPAAGKLPNNKGIEGLVKVPRGRPLGGTLIAFAERGLDTAGNHTAFLIGGPQPGSFTLRRHRDFDVSDAALLPSGDLLVLERRFTWVEGVGIQIRRIPLAQIKPGVLVDGPVIFSADMAHQIDNMEGLAVHQGGGNTILTLVSDDNFSAIQRTLLLQFTLME
ncbi:MAG: twin-arginine translocation pathway signal [Rhizobiales bacterium]|nr:twin-arginine translocation pathway signal [Hyphomicrobiales bacterium]